MPVPKIWFRADGNVQMGLGHLVRCMALADMLSADFRIHFACRELDGSIELDLCGAGYRVTRIDSEAEFIGSLTEGDIVVLDGYQFGTDYQKQIKSRHAALVCIDDIMDREFFADLVINQSPNASESDYQAQAYTDFALGTDFCLLRGPFLDAARHAGSVPKADDMAAGHKGSRVLDPGTVFICFGGSDAQNLTILAYNLVRGTNAFSRIILVTGASFGRREELEKIIETDTVTEHYQHIDAAQMAALMSEAGVKIVPGSGILYEALATGGKVISGYYTDNQIPNYTAFLGLNAIIGAGRFEPESLLEAISSLKSFHPAGNIIDGGSPDRFRAKFQNLSRRISTPAKNNYN